MDTLTAPSVTLRKSTPRLGTDPVTYRGKDGQREFTPVAYEVLVDGTVVGAIERDRGYRETLHAGMFVSEQWETVEWRSHWSSRDGRTHRSAHPAKLDALADVLGYGARLGATDGVFPPSAARPFATAARMEG